MAVFNEDTRVKIPATIQFMRLGYNYLSLKDMDMHTLGSLMVIVPQTEIINKFNKYIDTYFERIQYGIRENQQLASLRNFLLPMLMNGQVKVGKVNAING